MGGASPPLLLLLPLVLHATARAIPAGVLGVGRMMRRGPEILKRRAGGGAKGGAAAVDEEEEEQEAPLSVAVFEEGGPEGGRGPRGRWLVGALGSLL